MPKASLGMIELIKRLKDQKIERIAFERGITAEDATAFVHAIAALGVRGEASEPTWAFPHIRVGRIIAEERRSDGIGGDMAAIRQLYSNAVSIAEVAWESAETEGQPDLPATLQPLKGSPTPSRRTARRSSR